MKVDEFGAELIAFFGDHSLVKAAQVSVALDGEFVGISDALVLFREDGACVQLLLEQEGPRLRSMSSPADYEIIGEYGDRTADVLRAVELDGLPLEVRAIHVAYETGATTGEDYVIGVFMSDSNEKSARVSFICHVDDIKYGSRQMLWNYMDSVIAHTGLVSVRRFGSMPQ